MLSFNSQSFQLFNVFRSLSLFLCFLLLLLLLLLCISKFPFYIQRHYRKAFNSSHNVLCIWILTEEMETFFCWLLLFFHSQAKKKLWSCPSVSKVCIQKIYICVIGMVKWVPGLGMCTTMEKWVCSRYQIFF